MQRKKTTWPLSLQGFDWHWVFFTSHSTQKRSFRTRSSQPISWRSTEKAKPNTPFTRYNRLSNRLYNRFDSRVERTAAVHSTGCQTGLYNRIDNRLYTLYNWLSNRFDNLFNNRLYRVYKHLTGCQQVVSCKRGLTQQNKQRKSKIV